MVWRPLAGVLTATAVALTASASTQAARPQPLTGTGITSVTATPGDMQLSPRPPEYGTTGVHANVINGRTFDGLKVTIKNSGDTQITGLRVRVVLLQPGRFVKKVAEIDVINPGQSKVVRFGAWGKLKFALPSKFVVRSIPVAGELNRANNRTVLPVIFTIR